MGLTLEEIEGGPVYGPGGGDALPGVVVVHGGEGAGAGWSHRFAAILAAHGMLALPVAYGAGDVFGAGRIEDVDLGLIPAAGAALAGHGRCSGRVGLFGWSMGGEAALLAAAFDRGAFGCVAAHAAPDVISGAFDPDRFRATGRVERQRGGGRAWRWAGASAGLTLDLEPGARVPVERVAVPLFLSSGTADAVVAHAETLALASRARQAGRDVDLMVCEGEGHALSMAAEPALWARLMAFLREHLA